MFVIGEEDTPEFLEALANAELTGAGPTSGGLAREKGIGRAEWESWRS